MDEPQIINSGSASRKGIVSFLAVVLVVSLLLFFGNGSNSISTAYLTVMSPFKNAYTLSTNYLSMMVQKYFFLTRVFDENISLKTELMQLYQANNRLIEEKKELLRRISNLQSVETYQEKEKTSYPTLEAEVISKSFTGFSSSIIVNKGSAEGVRKGMPVLSGFGIIGQTTDISAHSSKVVLINDLSSAVDVILQENRHNGVVVGTGEVNALGLRYILKDFDVHQGEKVISSGYGGVFPKGLLVGEVKEITDDPLGLFKKITVMPYVNFRKIENVIILLVREGVALPPEEQPRKAEG